MAHTTEQERDRRAAVLQPLFAIARGRGLRRGWIAEQTGVTINRLWNYEHGYDRVPDGFIERFSLALGVPATLITIPEPHALYIQQPRVKRNPAPAKTPKQPRGGRTHGDPSSTPTARRDPSASASRVRPAGPVRRAQRPTPDAPAHDHHEARA